MYGKFIKYYYHKAFTIDYDALFDNPPTKEEVIKVVESLEGARIINKENDQIIFVYRGIRFKTEIIKFKGKYTVDGKEF